MNTASNDILIDVRQIPPRDRHALIFSTFDRLARGEALEIVNDHDPRPLYAHFQQQFPGQVGWDYLEHGPELWRVRILRTEVPEAQANPAAKPAHGQGGSCCGGCGGGH